MRTVVFAGLLVVCGFAITDAAVSVAPREQLADQVQRIVHTVETRYHSSHTLKAIFLERYSGGRQTDRLESGTVYFSRPGRMRWEYESPEQKLFITDGKLAWFYIPADHTVTRAPMKESDDWRTPLALLTGKADLMRYCKHIELATIPDAKSSNVVLRCVPAGTISIGKSPNGGNPAGDDSVRQALSLDQSNGIQDVLLEVDPVSGWLASVTIRQAGGIQMQYSFAKWEENVALPEAMFRFSAPKGVAIVGDDTQMRIPH